MYTKGREGKEGKGSIWEDDISSVALTVKTNPMPISSVGRNLTRRIILYPIGRWSEGGRDLLGRNLTRRIILYPIGRSSLD